MFDLGISACWWSRGTLHSGQLGRGGVHLTLVYVHSGVGGLCNTWSIREGISYLGISILV